VLVKTSGSATYLRRRTNLFDGLFRTGRQERESKPLREGDGVAGMLPSERVANEQARIYRMAISVGLENQSRPATIPSFSCWMNPPQV